MRPPVRSARKPYASVQDNPERTSRDMLGYLANGRIVFLSMMCAHLVAPRVESRLEFVTRRRRLKIKARIYSKFLTRWSKSMNVLTPNTPPSTCTRNSTVISRILHWASRYPAIPVFLCKGLVRGFYISASVHPRTPSNEDAILELHGAISIVIFRLGGPPSSRGAISALLLRFVSSFAPSRPLRMGDGRSTAYEYVDDMEFPDHWNDIRPWTSVMIWGWGLQSFLGTHALHIANRRVDGGGCATSITLWGPDICDESGNIPLPMYKPDRAQYLLRSCGARIEFHVLHVLCGRAERWGLRNTSLAPELHVVDRLLRS